MNVRFTRNHGYVLLVLSVAAVTLTATGCLTTMANLINAGWGNLVPAQFDGLREKRVAVICVSGSSAFGPSSASTTIARQVTRLLKKNVRDIEIIEQQHVERWIDENDWNQVDYLEIGRGVGADVLVAVDLRSFSLHDGQTMYRGRADVSVTVYDMAQGKDEEEVFHISPPQFQYPKNTGQHTADIAEAEFRRNFISFVSLRIARYFYPYEVRDDYANDTLILSSS